MRLEARGIEFSYGAVQVLFGVELTVGDREIVALLGTNGAGKTTLLEVLAGLQRPLAGSVTLDSIDVTGSDAKSMVSRGVVLVQGGRAVFDELTVRENLLVGLHAKHLSRPAATQAIDAVFDRIPMLADLASRRAGSLSGGEQQRLAIAKALLAEPRVLLIDELSLGLAPVVRDEVVVTVAQVRDAGASVVLVEQSLDTAVSLADRAVFLDKGEVRFEGRPADLLERGDLARAVFLGARR